ncbi:response regulator [uncultured Nitrospira sp.]|uniref:response regulator n=1 Tax=uncultured Nitrospira sp. TaxID=157176 RepID=UPI0031401122
MTTELLANTCNRYNFVTTRKKAMPQKESPGKIVMIVDDDIDFRLLLRDRLVRLGLLCVEAENGEKAKAQIKKKHVDLVITDYRMPRMDGLELIDWLKQTQRYMPIIFVSGDVSAPIRKKAEQAGVYAILEKPCSLADLSSRVKEAFDES